MRHHSSIKDTRKKEPHQKQKRNLSRQESRRISTVDRENSSRETDRQYYEPRSLESGRRSQFTQKEMMMSKNAGGRSTRTICRARCSERCSESDDLAALLERRHLSMISRVVRTRLLSEERKGAKLALQLS